MSESCFYAMMRVRLFFSKIIGVMKPRIHENVSEKERSDQFILWILFLFITSLPVSNVCLFLANSTPDLDISRFWSLIGLMVTIVGQMYGMLLVLIIVSYFLQYLLLRLLIMYGRMKILQVKSK